MTVHAKAFMWRLRCVEERGQHVELGSLLSFGS